jgi:hypothetical protein
MQQKTHPGRRFAATMQHGTAPQKPATQGVVGRWRKINQSGRRISFSREKTIGRELRDENGE